MRFLALALLSTLCACISARPLLKTSKEVQSKTKLSSDQFKGTAWVNGPRFTLPSPEVDGVYRGSAFFRTWSDGNSRQHQLYISTDMPDWMFWNQVHDRTGLKLLFLGISRDVERGLVEEDFVIVMSEDYLRSLDSVGMEFQVSSNRGKFRFFAPGHYARGHLLAVETHLGGPE